MFSLRLSAAFLVLAFAPLIIAQLPFPDACPQIKTMDTFDNSAYLGDWFEHSKYPFIFEIGKKCIYATYGPLDNETITVVNYGTSRLTNTPSHIEGRARIVGPGQLIVSFSRSSKSDIEFNHKPNYIVLDTDYVNYAVVYSCRNITQFAHLKIVWILTRERQAPQSVIDAAKQVLDKNKIATSFLMNTKQDNCPDPNATTTEATSTDSGAKEEEENALPTSTNETIIEMLNQA